jgi:hypothetical protein
MPQSKDMVADKIAWIIGTPRKREAMLNQKRFNESTGPKLFTISILVSEIITRHADLPNARDD